MVHGGLKGFLSVVRKPKMDGCVRMVKPGLYSMFIVGIEKGPKRRTTSNEEMAKSVV